MIHIYNIFDVGTNKKMFWRLKNTIPETVPIFKYHTKKTSVKYGMTFLQWWTKYNIGHIIQFTKYIAYNKYSIIPTLYNIHH